MAEQEELKAKRAIQQQQKELQDIEQKRLNEVRPAAARAPLLTWCWAVYSHVRSLCRQRRHLGKPSWLSKGLRSCGSSSSGRRLRQKRPGAHAGQSVGMQLALRVWVTHR